MAKYKFENWNIEIIDPIVTCSKLDKEGNPIVEKIDAAAMTIDINILMTTATGTKFGYYLDAIKVEDLTYKAADIMPRIMARLADFEVP